MSNKRLKDHATVVDYIKQPTRIAVSAIRREIDRCLSRKRWIKSGVTVRGSGLCQEATVRYIDANGDTVVLTITRYTRKEEKNNG